MRPNKPSRLAEGAVIGILGGGQLGLMLARAAKQLGFQAHIYAPEDELPARAAADKVVRGAYEDAGALADFGGAVDVVTYEFENIALGGLQTLEGVGLFPPLEALRVAQDRWLEKEFCRTHAIATTRSIKIDSEAELLSALDALGGDGILKTRRLGYDGKGQWSLASAGDARDAHQALAGAPAILEARVAFQKEVSWIGARFADDSIGAFAMTENEHQNHILHKSHAPAALAPELEARAHEIGKSLLRGLNYYGVLAIEFFVCGTELLVNEMAPRVHNSGHWTLDGAAASQFEQHIRALAGWDAASFASTHDAMMQNILGDEVQNWTDTNALPDQHLHLYGKTQARAGRKMGHVTTLFPLGKRPRKS